MMIYEDYKVASLRHLQTCQYMYQHLDSVTDPIENANILADIYYLSGYVMECITNYAIYKYVKFNPQGDVQNLNYPKISFSTINQGKKYYIATHNFQRNSKILPHGSKKQQIPFIGDDKPSKYLAVKDLYWYWHPGNIRYSLDSKLTLQLTKPNIKLFVELAEEIYNKTYYLY